MKVLIAVDESNCSDQAVSSLLERNWPEAVEFRVVTVVEPISLGFPDALTTVQPLIDARNAYIEQCWKRLKELKGTISEKIKMADVDVQVLEGDVPHSIVHEAKNWRADLLVLGSHGRRGFQRLVLGSVAERVASHAPCTVEIIKPRQPKRGEEQASGSLLSAANK